MDLLLSHIRFKNKERAKRYHPEGIKGWELEDWGIELAGELGEMLNVVKKLKRAKSGMAGNKAGMTERELRAHLKEEVGDVLIALDLFAARAGINLGSAAIEKFNKTSDKLGFPERLLPFNMHRVDRLQQLNFRDGWWWVRTPQGEEMGPYSHRSVANRVVDRVYGSHFHMEKDGWHFSDEHFEKSYGPFKTLALADEGLKNYIRQRKYTEGVGE